MSTKNEEKEMSISEIIFSVIIFAISIYSAYISWNCKSNQNKSTIVRVIYAFFAFTFGVLYQIFNALRAEGVC